MIVIVVVHVVTVLLLVDVPIDLGHYYVQTGSAQGYMYMKKGDESLTNLFLVNSRYLEQ